MNEAITQSEKEAAIPRQVHRLSAKTAIGIVGVVLSSAAIVACLLSSWGNNVHIVSSSRNNVTMEQLLAATSTQQKICIRKVFIKSSAWEKEEPNSSWHVWQKKAVRGWVAPSVIDVVIDFSKLPENSFVLTCETNGSHRTRLEISSFPLPEIDTNGLKGVQSNKLKVVLKHGEIENEDLLRLQARAFERIKLQIYQLIQKNERSIIDDSKMSAVAAISQFYKSVGVDEVVVHWNDERKTSESASLVTLDEPQDQGE